MTEKDSILSLLEREQLSAEDASSLLSLTASLGQAARKERMFVLELLERAQLSPREAGDIMAALGTASSPGKQLLLELFSNDKLNIVDLRNLLELLERSGHSTSGEQMQILELLESEQVSLDEAKALLAALSRDLVPVPAPPAAALPPRPLARALNIFIHAKGPGGEKTQLDVSIPLKLSKFSSKFMPDAAKALLQAQGIDLSDLIASFSGDLPEGPLIDIDNKSEDGSKVKIKVEVL